MAILAICAIGVHDLPCAGTIICQAKAESGNKQIAPSDGGTAGRLGRFPSMNHVAEIKMLVKCIEDT